MSPETMLRPNLRINEKRWKHKALFHRRRRHPLIRFAITLLILSVLVALAAWWLEAPLLEQLPDPFLS